MKVYMMCIAKMFLVIFSLTFFLFSCTEEVVQEETLPKPVQTDDVQPSDDTTEQVSQDIVHEISQVLNNEEQNGSPSQKTEDQVADDNLTSTKTLDSDGTVIQEEVNEGNLVDTVENLESQEQVTTSSDDPSIEIGVEEDHVDEPTGTVELELVPKPREYDAYGRSVSDEQDFASVVQRESIESDIQRIKENEDKLVIYDPIEHPEKAGHKDVVSFALNTKHTPGTVLFRRNTVFFNRDKYLERCDTYVDSEAAQQAFLDAGGPEEDELNLDPDGDGFACSWNPEKYRLILQ